MKILIAGDLVPTKTNLEFFKKKDFIKKLEKDFIDLWLSSDYRMFNLECPLGEKFNPIKKNGPSLIADSLAINGIKSLKPDLVFLANNHILDYGEEGLKNTEKLLKQEQINYIGIIENKNVNSKTHIIKDNNISVGFYNLCENEFSVATNTSKGANGLDEIKNYKEIMELKKNVDFVVVVYHGGKEFYRYPSPNLQKICRNFVDFGADVVLVQHSHCIGCEEKYKDAKIVYGQGNFIFDDGEDEYLNTSLIVELNITKNNIKVNYIPIEKNKELIIISKNKSILEDFNNRSKEILNKYFIINNYKQFSLSYLNHYLNFLNRIRFITKIFNRIFKRKYFTKIYSKQDCIRILNILECEAHRELFIEGLKNKINEGEKK